MATQQAGDDAAERPRARCSCSGAYDLHVHVAPDVPQRRIDDRALAQRFAELGLAGFALKSHYTSTAERAQVVSALFPGVEVVGTLTLNRAVGGMNALAVEIAAREGARIVWMPTVDSPAETAGRTEPKDGRQGSPVGAPPARAPQLGLSVEAVHVTDADGRLLPETRDVLRAIARHDLILATGHLARDDTFAVVDGALEEGVAEIVVTHPEFPCQNFSIEDQQRARRARLPARALPDDAVQREDVVGARLRRRARRRHRALALLERLREPDYPPVEDGLALWADRLLDGGFDEDDVHEMIVGQSRRLAGAA